MFNLSKIDFYKALEKIKTTSLASKLASLFAKKQEEPVVYTFQRKVVADLILKVLTQQLLAREALLKFPEDAKDPSIVASWHALCHLESDEDFRRRDPAYANEQNDFLEMIAFTLQTGDELPENIINSYKKYHEEALIPHSKGMKGIISKLTRFLNL